MGSSAVCDLKCEIGSIIFFYPKIRAQILEDRIDFVFAKKLLL